MNTILQGTLVRLAAINPETDAEHFARWGQDAEYLRLLDSCPARPLSAKRVKELLEEWLWVKEQPNDRYLIFTMRRLADDRPIGLVDLWFGDIRHGDSWVGIGIGERELWGQGYGTDAMRVLLRYAFTELSLHRVSLNVFGYNERALRSYEKAGFTVEGRARNWLNRDGQRWDLVYMGILRTEWERLNGMTRAA